MEDNSASDLYLDWLDLSSAPAFVGGTGRLGMTLLPGRRCPGWAVKAPRDLERDARALAALGVKVFVLLVEDHELITCGVPTFCEVLADHGIKVLRCPIVDGQTPRDRSSAPRPPSGQGIPEPGDIDAFTKLVGEIEGRLRLGQTIGVSCRGGLGRTGVLAACLLKRAGLDADAAIAEVRRARPGAVENPRQEAFIRAW
jgi:protein-tyrosine phosphatase